MAKSTYLSIITLNVNRLNALIKRYRVAKWLKYQDPSMCCIQETHFRAKEVHIDWSKEMEKEIPWKMETES